MQFFFGSFPPIPNLYNNSNNGWRGFSNLSSLSKIVDNKKYYALGFQMRYHIQDKRENHST